MQRVFFLTEVLSKDGNMKNGVTVLPLAVADIMFNVVASNGALGMECVEGPLLPIPRCYEQRGLTVYVLSPDQFRILVYQKLAHIRLAQGGCKVERILISVVDHISHHMGINNIQKLLHHISSTVGYSQVQGGLMEAVDLGRLDDLFVLLVDIYHRIPISTLVEFIEIVKYFFKC